MSDELLILESNIASIQDIGRYGLENYGFSINGALDQFAYKISNALLGNPLETPAIEVTAFNFALKSHVDISVCVTGAQAIVEADNEVMPQWETFILKKEKKLRISKIHSGMRVYINIAGGVNVPLIHGSASYDSMIGIGTKLTKGDTLSLNGSLTNCIRDKVRMPKDDIPGYQSPWKINVCPGPDVAIFKKHIKVFEEAKFRVSLESDNIGIRLEKYRLTKFSPQQNLSRGIIPGAIEITPHGQPIILHRGRGGTIGYPVIACISSADLDLAGQVRPHDTVRFTFISTDKAIEIYRKREKYIRQILDKSLELNDISTKEE
ncbi:biotin-dependent carboxyltransferase family protein [Bacillus sp. A134]|uniref:biotin-dependent carboxyltransferase family protein n=1 Tax=Oceanobacillus sp. FSL K6-3682 TaxID=2921503 RepID=UPI0012ED861D